MPKLLTSVHRNIWQRLPQTFRRQALFRATAAVAPRPSTGVSASGPIIVAGAFTTASGLGQSARMCYSALRQAGHSVFGINLTTELMQPADFPVFDYDDGRTVYGPGTLILHVNSPLVPLAMLRLGRRIVREKRIVGCWAWELPNVPDEWRIGVPFVHEIVTPSHFVSGAMQAIALGRPVHVVPYPVMISQSFRPRPARDPRQSFTVLTILNIASSLARKNPCAAIEAFRLAFGDDPTARLIVKVANLSAYHSGKNLIERAIDCAGNIMLTDRIMSAAELDELYGDADALVSLHRSEGFGLTLAEAMVRGIPVVATNWSGNADFLTNETGCPVPYHLVPAVDPQATYNYPDMEWAEADVTAGAAMLKRLRDDPDFAVQRAREAARYAARYWTTERYAERLLAHLGITETAHP